MKHLLVGLIIFSGMSNAFADIRLSEDQADTIEVVENNSEVNKITISEIKDYLKTVDQNSTCIDEYLHRRKQLILKLVLTPVVATAATMASVYVGGASGVLIAEARYGSTNDGWAGLGYAIGGAMIGGAVSVVSAGVNLTMTGVDIYNIDLVMKSLAELHLGKAGEKSEKLYAKYAKSAEAPIEENIFFEKLMEADASGTLCDGSMVKQPRFHFGTKLKYKVAKPNEIFKSLSI